MRRVSTDRATGCEHTTDVRCPWVAKLVHISEPHRFVCHSALFFRRPRPWVVHIGYPQEKVTDVCHPRPWATSRKLSVRVPSSRSAPPNTQDVLRVKDVAEPQVTLTLVVESALRVGASTSIRVVVRSLGQSEGRVINHTTHTQTPAQEGCPSYEWFQSKGHRNSNYGHEARSLVGGGGEDALSHSPTVPQPRNCNSHLGVGWR